MKKARKPLKEKSIKKNDQRELPYAKQSLSDSDREAVLKALQSDIITRGDHVEQFENAVAKYCDVEHAVAFSSGTAALMAAYAASELHPFDHMITTPNTFVCTSGAAIQRGVRPVFVDIDRDSGNLDLELLHVNLYRSSSRGRPVLAPVHFAGIPVDMKKLDAMIVDADTVVIEDAAHAWGASYSCGSKVGSCRYSDMTVFSMHPAKNITMGEGGVVTTKDEELCHRLKRFRNNGIDQRGVKAPWHYDVLEFSGNYNVTDFAAALGHSQLQRLDAFVKKRRALVAHYRKQFKDFPNVRLFSESYDELSGHHLFVAQIDFDAFATDRATVMKALLEKGIGTQVHYIPLYHFSVFREKEGDLSSYFPETEAYYRQALSLPLYYDLTEEDVAYVVESLRAVLIP